jgi:NAD+--asparagine ADP-ribosyltransferase
VSFNEKIEALEVARKQYPEFNKKFLEYLEIGNSFNGAYNHFSLDDIKVYEPKEVKVKQPTTAVKAAAVKLVQGKPATK